VSLYGSPAFTWALILWPLEPVKRGNGSAAFAASWSYWASRAEAEQAAALLDETLLVWSVINVLQPRAGGWNSDVADKAIRELRREAKRAHLGREHRAQQESECEYR
jgi:hypothetical protein